MRVCLVLAVVFLTAGALIAGQAAAAQAGEVKTVKVDRNGDGVLDGVDVYDENDTVVKRGYDRDGDSNVDWWETYDSNTGLPIVTESDAAFELR